jgi:hypothetical protein
MSKTPADRRASKARKHEIEAFIDDEFEKFVDGIIFEDILREDFQTNWIYWMSNILWWEDIDSEKKYEDKKNEEMVAWYEDCMDELSEKS